MKYAYDLHIHSALSPCSDDEMTPNNIVNMALLKELDIIAVTDHNSAENLRAVCRCGEESGLLVVPGMEIESSEEVHIVCLFPDVESAMKVQEKVYKALPDIVNRKDIFGNQLIMNENDNVIREIDRMLLTAAALSIEEIFAIVKTIGGVALPAHVDRDSYSIISNLGKVPDNLDIKYLEISKGSDELQLFKLHPELAEFKLLRSSDAHQLGDIMERENFIEIEELSVKSILDKLSKK